MQAHYDTNMKATLPAHMQTVKLLFELIVLVLQVINDGLVLCNVLLHRPGVLPHMGLDLLCAVSIL